MFPLEGIHKGQDVRDISLRGIKAGVMLERLTERMNECVPS